MAANRYPRQVGVALFSAATCLFLTFQAESSYADCAPLPNNLQNGQAADASQVMGNFNGILACGRFSGNVSINSAPANPPTQDLEVWGNSNPIAVFWNSGAFGTGGIQLVGSRTSPATAYSMVMFTNTEGVAPPGISSVDARIQAFQDGNNDATALAFNTTPHSGSLTEVMRITSTGNVGIGTSSPATALSVVGTGTSTGGWTTSSDGRLKKNVAEISGALDIISRLRGVRFEWLPAEQRKIGKELTLPLDAPQVGFIAQEVGDVVPEAVATPPQGTDGVYAMDYSKIVPILVEAVKQQQAEIKSQQAEIGQLETLVAKLEAKK